MNILYLSILLSMSIQLFSVWATTNDATMNTLQRVSRFSVLEFLYAEHLIRKTLYIAQECTLDSTGQGPSVHESCAASPSLKNTDKPAPLTQRRACW